MKYIIIILVLSSCTKDWKCDVTTSTGQTATIDFRGTTQEKNDYESNGTYSNGSIDVETNCY